MGNDVAYFDHTLNHDTFKRFDSVKYFGVIMTSSLCHGSYYWPGHYAFVNNLEGRMYTACTKKTKQLITGSALCTPPTASVHDVTKGKGLLSLNPLSHGSRAKWISL
ncbi:hypothetical protein J6590_097110 [Homalodisca vitripennis]|nr:hypothetical protein J6590_097110 [Homalodisca vitripennis]